LRLRLLLRLLLRLRWLNRPRRRPVIALLRLFTPALAAPTTLPLLAPKTLAVGRDGGRKAETDNKSGRFSNHWADQSITATRATPQKWDSDKVAASVAIAAQH
jgi:hypothetical protein